MLSPHCHSDRELDSEASVAAATEDKAEKKCRWRNWELPLRAVATPMSRPPFRFTRRRSFAVAAMSDDPISLDYDRREGNPDYKDYPSWRSFLCQNEQDSEFLVDDFDMKTVKLAGPMRTCLSREALGLNAMYETGTIRVPKPFKLCHRTGGSVKLVFRSNARLTTLFKELGGRGIFKTCILKLGFNYTNRCKLVDYDFSIDDVSDECSDEDGDECSNEDELTKKFKVAYYPREDIST
ncbi:hypothetical protein LINPERHAP2_LOCUS4291 [Linum perenne]